MLFHEVAMIFPKGINSLTPTLFAILDNFCDYCIVYIWTMLGLGLFVPLVVQSDDEEGGRKTGTAGDNPNFNSFQLN